MRPDKRFSMRSTVKRAAPALPFEKIARSILGPRYELSLTICGDDLARRMNRTYRPGRAGKKTYAPNVLSFPYSKHEGEIFLNVRKSAREAAKFGLPKRERLAYLFIHGCFHLAGHDHGTKMERLEKSAMRKLGFSA